MATYTGDAQAKPGTGTMLWLAVVAFVVAAVLVITLIAVQGGTPVPSHPVTGQTQGQVSGPAGARVPMQQIPLGKGICHQCAP